MGFGPVQVHLNGWNLEKKKKKQQPLSLDVLVLNCSSHSIWTACHFLILHSGAV